MNKQASQIAARESLAAIINVPCQSLTRKERLDNHKERRGDHGEQHDVDENFEPLITLHE